MSSFLTGFVVGIVATVVIGYALITWYAVRVWFDERSD
jgi:hypothetical protein